jgi:hypothetical protein
MNSTRRDSRLSLRESCGAKRYFCGAKDDYVSRPLNKITVSESRASAAKAISSHGQARIFTDSSDNENEVLQSAQFETVHSSHATPRCELSRTRLGESSDKKADSESRVTTTCRSCGCTRPCAIGGREGVAIVRQSFPSADLVPAAPFRKSIAVNSNA